MTPYKTTMECVRRSTYIPQTIMSICINFGINFGLAWASYSDWGKRGHNYASWPEVAVWAWSYELNSNLVLDITMTCLFMGFFCTLLATNGAQKDVKDKKCDVLEHAVLTKGWWRWTPARIHSICLRSAAIAVYVWVLVGWPTIILLSIALRNTFIPGLDWVIIKGVWAPILSIPIYTMVYFSAISSRNFPEIEFEALMKQAAGDAAAGGHGSGLDAPPLVGNVGHV